MRILIILIGLIVLPAHGGGLNKEGCHNNRQTGDYHCHRGAKSKANKQAEPILTGVPRIIDGDTIRIGNTGIRPHGINAPEAKQTRTWPTLCKAVSGWSRILWRVSSVPESTSAHIAGKADLKWKIIYRPPL